MGEEYAAFHYLAHDTPEHTKVVHVEARKPLTFHELYSPRGENGAPVLVGKKEKSFWRTGDCISFSFYECRAHKCMIISCVDVSSKEGKAFKTILVNLELLYSILELRRRTVNDADEGDEGDEEGDVSGGIKFKSQKKLGDDASLHKACIEYLEKRLNIGTDPVDWPHFDEEEWKKEQAMKAAFAQSRTEGDEAATEEESKGGGGGPPGQGNESVIAPELSADITRKVEPIGNERMACLNLLHDDKEPIELPVEVLISLKVDLSGIDSSLLKLQPTPNDSTKHSTPTRSRGGSKEAEKDEDDEAPGLAVVKTKPSPVKESTTKSPKSLNKIVSSS